MLDMAENHHVGPFLEGGALFGGSASQLTEKKSGLSMALEF